jgi:hypothetical protein
MVDDRVLFFIGRYDEMLAMTILRGKRGIMNEEWGRQTERGDRDRENRNGETANGPFTLFALWLMARSLRSLYG